MRKFTIVHVCTSASFLRYLGQTLVALDSRGYEVHLICSPGMEVDRYLGESNLVFHPVQIERAVNPIDDMRALAQITIRLRRLRPSLVHAHTPKAGLLGMLAAFSLRVPHRVYHLHGLRYEGVVGAGRFFLESAERLSCLLAQYVICVSSSVKRKAVRDGALNLRKACILGGGSAQGLHFDDFRYRDWVQPALEFRSTLSIPKEAPVAGYFGRLSGDKGLAELGKVWKMVLEKIPDANLIVAGAEDPTDPVDLSELRKLSGVHLVGDLDEVRPALAACHAVVLLSRREGFPQVALEAGAMGIPLIATRVTGTEDAIRPGVTGDLIEWGNWKECARMLASRLGDKSARRVELDEATRAQFSTSTIVAELARRYSEILDVTSQELR